MIQELVLVNVDSEKVGLSQQKPCPIACRCICYVWLSEPSGEDEDDACRWLSARGGVANAVHAGVGKIVRERPASELALGVAGEDGC